jgi:hypothetical protein
MRSFLLILIGALVGAALFHLYYVRLAPEGRCGWDHPLDDRAKAACVSQASFTGYGKAARHEMDDLVGKLGQ